MKNIVWEGLINARLISFLVITTFPLWIGGLAVAITLFLEKFKLIPEDK